MSFLSSLNLNSGPAVSRRSQLAKVPLPPEFSTVCAWQKSNKKYEPSGYQIHHRQIPKLIECRAMEVAGVDASQEVREKLGPSVRTPEEVNKKMADLIAYVKELLMTSGDGRISVAPYDTSVVALIKDLEGDDAPEFPSCLEWIAENQMGDGSWGDEFFCIYDRLVNTLACVVALKSWNVHLDKIEKGVSYIRENVHKLKDGNIEHMTSGFEIVVPAMFERAKALGIQNLPYHHPSVKAIYAAKETRLSKIPKDLIYKLPTTLLYSLEGVGDLDWEKIMKLQWADGSFLTSPSSTAHVFMHTKDQKCLKFIQNALKNCNGGGTNEQDMKTLFIFNFIN